MVPLTPGRTDRQAQATSWGHRPARAAVLAVALLLAGGTAWWLGHQGGDEVVSSIPSTEGVSTTAGPHRSPRTTYPTTTTTAAPAPLLTLSGHADDVQHAAFSPDGTTIATSGGFDGTVRIWDAATGAVRAVLPAPSSTAEFSSDGALLVTSAMDGTATVWDVARAELLSTLPGTPGYLGAASAAFRPGGAEVVTARGDDAAWVWDGRTGRLLRQLTAGPGRVQMAAFSPDGSKILTNRLTVDAVELWEWPSGRHLATLGGGQFVHAASFSADGRRVVVCASVEGTIWDASTGRQIATLSSTDPPRSTGMTSAAFRPDGERVVTVDPGVYGVFGSANVYNASDGTLLATLGQETDATPSPSHATFSPDGTRILVVRHHQNDAALQEAWIEIWDATSATLVRTFRAHGEGVVWAEFSPDGATFVTASRDDTARVWALDG